MIITGYTSNKLDLVSRYSKTNPYVVGVNGVTNITYLNSTDQTVSGITSISYTINEVDYLTTIPNFQTTFSVSVSQNNFDPYYVVKEEAKMGIVFPPKVVNELFIERQSLAVFELHSRLSEIKTLDDLVDYRNGYYNIQLQ